MKFKILNKGLITQGFNENANGAYAAMGMTGHPGIDWTQGWGSRIQADNGGYCYKVFLPQERPDNWSAVYILVPDGDDFIEWNLGHLSRIFIREGMDILEGQYVGKEGNFGLVYSGGTQITPEMQDAGDHRGSHVHEQYRPVRRVTKALATKHYLENKDGSLYKDKDGFYYEVKNENGTQGCVSPMDYVYKDTVADKVRCISNAVTNLFKAQ